MSAPIPIRTRTDLLGIARLRRSLRVRIRLPGLEDEDAARLEAQFNRLLGECGCRASAAFLSVAVLLTGIIDIVFRHRIGGHVAAALLWELSAVVCAAILGRLFGRLLARARLRGSVRRLANAFPT